MRLELIAAAALAVVACAACDAGSRSDLGPVGGRFLVHRVAKREAKVADGPGRASYCPDDSLLFVLAIGRAWTGGFAVRVALPLREELTFRVQRSLDGIGTATAAFRPLDAGAAQLAVGGTLQLEPSKTVSGRFAVAAPDSAGVHVSFRGTLSHLPLDSLPRGSCQSP